MNLNLIIMDLQFFCYKHRYEAVSSKYSTKPLFLLFTKILQKYCTREYFRRGVNRWILKNSKKL